MAARNWSKCLRTPGQTVVLVGEMVANISLRNATGCWATTSDAMLHAWSSSGQADKGDLTLRKYMADLILFQNAELSIWESGGGLTPKGSRCDMEWSIEVSDPRGRVVDVPKCHW